MTSGAATMAAAQRRQRAAESTGLPFSRRFLERTCLGLPATRVSRADDHAALRAALREMLNGAAYQRCYVHFLRNALNHLPRKSDPHLARSAAHPRRREQTTGCSQSKSDAAQDHPEEAADNAYEQKHQDPGCRLHRQSIEISHWLGPLIA